MKGSETILRPTAVPTAFRFALRRNRGQGGRHHDGLGATVRPLRWRDSRPAVDGSGPVRCDCWGDDPTDTSTRSLGALLDSER